MQVDVHTTSHEADMHSRAHKPTWTIWQNFEMLDMLDILFTHPKVAEAQVSGLIPLSLTYILNCNATCKFFFLRPLGGIKWVYMSDIVMHKFYSITVHLLPKTVEKLQSHDHTWHWFIVQNIYNPFPSFGPHTK